MEFMSAREAADKWGISQRRVAILCAENRIENATMVGNMWIIPATAEKPLDARSVRYAKSDETKVKPFLKWAGGKGQLLSEIEKCSFVRVKGIMVIIPKGDSDSNRAYFKRTKEIFESLKNREFKNIKMEILSMGMTHDYKIAIEEGSTLVRIGEGIFGKRDYNI